MKDRIPTEDLLDELRRLGDVVDGTPSVTDMRERGNHSTDTYATRFGSWNEAVERAGFEPNRSSERVPTKTLISDVQRVADELGHPPSINEYREHGNHSIPTYMSRFGSWPESKEAAGLEPGTPNPIPRDWLLRDLSDLIDQVGGRPTTEQLNSVGSYSDSTYRNRFGSIHAAIDAAEEFSSSDPVDKSDDDTDETDDTDSDDDIADTGVITHYTRDKSRLFTIDEFAYNEDEVEELLSTVLEELDAARESYHDSDLEVLHLEVALSIESKPSEEELDAELGSEGEA